MCGSLDQQLVISCAKTEEWPLTSTPLEQSLNWSRICFIVGAYEDLTLVTQTGIYK